MTQHNTTFPSTIFHISPTLKRCSAKLATYRPVILHPPPAVSRYYRALLPPLFYHFAGQRSFLATDVISQALPPQQPHLASCRLDFVCREETGLKTALKTREREGEKRQNRTPRHPKSELGRPLLSPNAHINSFPGLCHARFLKPRSRRFHPQTDALPSGLPAVGS